QQRAATRHENLQRSAEADPELVERVAFHADKRWPIVAPGCQLSPGIRRLTNAFRDRSSRNPCRAARSPSPRTVMMGELWQDVRYGIRGRGHAPGFTAVAVLTLALGIGANSAIFSFVDGVLLKPIAFHDPERIVQLLEKPPSGGFNSVSALNFLDWQSQST